MNYIELAVDKLRDALCHPNKFGQKYIEEAIAILEPPKLSKHERIAVELDNIAPHMTTLGEKCLRNIAAILREPK